jgi:hypothetical protein
MTYKTILVHWDASPESGDRLAVAADLAQRFRSHLTGLYTRPVFRPCVVTDRGFAMGDLYRAYDKTSEADQEAAAAGFLAAIDGKDISSD